MSSLLTPNIFYVAKNKWRFKKHTVKMEILWAEKHNSEYFLMMYVCLFMESPI